MLSEEMLAHILNDEGFGIYDEDGNEGNIFVGFIPEQIDSDYVFSLKKTGGRRTIKVLGGARNDIVTIYMKCDSYIQASEILEEICSRLLNKSYEFENYIVENIFVINEPAWLSTIDGISLYDCSLYITVSKK